MVCKRATDVYVESISRNAICHNCCCWLIIILLSGIVLRSFPILYPNDGSQVQPVDPFAPAKINVDGKTYSQNLYLSGFLEDQNTSRSSFTFVFDTVDGTEIFTPENLQIICEVEEMIYEEATDFVSCLPDESELTCVTQRSSSPPGTSIASIFYAYNQSDPSTLWSPAGVPFPFPHISNVPLGTLGFNASSCDLLPQSTVDAVTALLESGLTVSPTTLQLYGFFLEKDTSTLGFSIATRSVLSLSVPEEGSEKLESVAARIEKKLFSYFGMEAGFLRSVYRSEARRGNVKALFFEPSLISTEFSTMIFTDFFMIFGSFIFVFVWMFVYTRSLVVAIPCVLGIFASVPVAMFFYKVVFRIEYFDFIHILAVFIILGIGADDVFVVYDAWLQSKIHHKTEVERLRFTVNRSAQSVFNTSFTTASAFIVTGITPLVPISSFGIFAALTIIVCFVFTLTLFPTTILLWDRCFNHKNEVEESAEAEAAVEKELQETKVDLEKLATSSNWIIHKYYIPFVQRFNKFLVLLGLIMAALGMAGLSQFSPLTKPEEFLPRDHMLQIFSDTVGNKWAAGQDAEYIPLDVYWGVQNIERNVFGWYTGNESRYGDTLIFDDEFDLSDPAAQNAISSFCTTLRTEPCTFSGCQGLGFLILPTGEFDCPINDFHFWWNTTFGNTDYLKENKNSTERDEFFARLQTFAVTEDKLEFIGFIDGDLKYFGTAWRLSANPIAPASEKKPIEDLLDSLTKEFNANAPTTAKNARFASEEFVQNAVEEALLQTTIRGLGITFPLVFVVLLYATNNYFLAIYACSSIAFIVICVLGTIFGGLGWELGIAESIVSIMIVGLSVDYTVHLGHMYTYAGREERLQTRDERFRYASLTMGMTVLAGGSTTLGAGIFLFGAQITFFTKMAILLTLTVIFSLFYSFFFMMALASWVGPEGTRGTVCGCRSSNQVIGTQVAKTEL